MSNSNIFAVSAMKRQQEQTMVHRNVGLMTPESDDTEKVSTVSTVTATTLPKVKTVSSKKKKTRQRKVRIDATVPESTKDKLFDYADKKGLSVSVVLQMIIEDACV